MNWDDDDAQLQMTIESVLSKRDHRPPPKRWHDPDVRQYYYRKIAEDILRQLRFSWSFRRRVDDKGHPIANPFADDPSVDPAHRRMCCDFCHQHQGQVQRLIAGPGVLICDECVYTCADMLQRIGVQPKAKLISEASVEAVKTWLDDAKAAPPAEPAGEN